jgi:integrase
MQIDSLPSSTDGDTAAPSTERRTRSRRRRARRLNGEGSIVRRADGRWCAALCLEGGRRRYFYGATADEAQKKLHDAREAIRQGKQIDDEKMTVGVLLERFLDERRSRTRAATMIHYENCVRKHIKPVLGHLRLRKLTAADVQRFLDMKTTEGFAVGMVRHLRTTLRMAVQLGVGWDVCSRNVVDFVRGPKGESKHIDPLTIEETKKLLDAAGKHRLAPLWLLATTLALRRGELLGLTWDAIDLDRGTLEVRSQLQRLRGETKFCEPKTENARRVLHLTHAHVGALREHRARQAEERLRAGPYWKDEHGLVFTQVDGRPILGPAISQTHRRLCRAAKVREVRLHDLRHGAASIMLASGVDPRTLSETLGHSRVSFTLNTYTHAKRPQLDDAVDRLSAILLGR